MDGYGNPQYGSQNTQSHMQPDNVRPNSSSGQYSHFVTQDAYTPQYPMHHNSLHSKNASSGQAFDFGNSPHLPSSSSMDLGQQNNDLHSYDSNDSASRATMSPFEVVPSSAMSQDSLMQPGSIFAQTQSHPMASAQGLGLLPQYMNPHDPYGMSTQAASFDSQMVASSPMDMTVDGHYMSNNNNNTSMGMNGMNGLNYTSAGLQSMMNGPTMDFNIMPQNQYHNPQMSNLSLMQSNSRRASIHDSTGNARIQQQQQTPSRRSSQTGDLQQIAASQAHASELHSDHSRRNSMPTNGQPSTQYPSQASMELQGAMQLNRPAQPQLQSHQQRPQDPGDEANSNAKYDWQSSQIQQQQQQQATTQQLLQQTHLPQSQPVDSGAVAQAARRQSFKYVNAYSSTGFDMIGVLSRVANRKNPEISIGAVDLSCAFVVCDANEHDFPIIYCSENFERLTGYTKHEILGRNCRFLQAPDGRVQVGVKRAYVDDDSVLYLKNMITARREVQVSLINYRKGGQPFMNLLTTIPVLGDNDEVRYFVGFQVDLVEQPNSVTNKNPDGTYAINYQRGLQMPRYIFDPTKRAPPPQLEVGQTVSRDDVSIVLNTMQEGPSEYSQRIWDKVLLENADDVVFVLSLKGLFLYLSPSSKKMLEYEANELVGTALSSVCHPSDIVPVTRELKDTTTGASVDVVFRFRRKDRGYMWFEGHGSLHTEQGKGRKSIVLVGRERPVYTLSKSDILASGGIGDNEIWAKLSTSGVFLFVASNVKQLLDRTQEDLIGTSIQALMRADSRPDFSRILEIAKTGKRASVKHELMNKRGQVVQAFSTLYPGDAPEGQKPTFIISQSRLIKYTRPSGSSSRAHPTKLDRQPSSIISGGKPAESDTPNSSSFTFAASPHTNSSPGISLSSPQRYMSTFESAATTSGQHGLALGHQDLALASSENLFDELKTTRSTSWQYELRQMEKRNRLLAEELQSLLAARKKRKRRKQGATQKDCANCHTRVTPEWRRGPSGQRDLCNSCGLRWAKQQGRISPRTNKSASSRASGAESGSPASKVGKGGTPIGQHGQSGAAKASEGKRQVGGMSGPADVGVDTATASGAKHSRKSSDVALSRNSTLTGQSSAQSEASRLEKEDSHMGSNKIMRVERDDIFCDVKRPTSDMFSYADALNTNEIFDTKFDASGDEEEEEEEEGGGGRAGGGEDGDGEEEEAQGKEEEGEEPSKPTPQPQQHELVNSNEDRPTASSANTNVTLGDMGIAMNPMRHSGDPNTGTELDDVMENESGEVDAENAHAGGVSLS